MYKRELEYYFKNVSVPNKFVIAAERSMHYLTENGSSPWFHHYSPLVRRTGHQNNSGKNISNLQRSTGLDT